MAKNIIIILIILSILLYFVADFLLNKAAELYKKYHVVKMHEKNNNNIYSSIRFYDEPTSEWKEVKQTYTLLMTISLFLEYFSTILFCSTIVLYVIYRQKKKPVS